VAYIRSTYMEYVTDSPSLTCTGAVTQPENHSLSGFPTNLCVIFQFVNSFNSLPYDLFIHVDDLK